MLPHELRAVFVPFIAHSIRNYAATYAYVLFDKCQHDVNNLCAESSTVRSALFAPPIGSFGFTVSSAGRTHLLGDIPPSSPRQCVQSPREVHAALHENFRTWGVTMGEFHHTATHSMHCQPSQLQCNVRVPLRSADKDACVQTRIASDQC